MINSIKHLIIILIASIALISCSQIPKVPSSTIIIDDQGPFIGTTISCEQNSNIYIGSSYSSTNIRPPGLPSSNPESNEGIGHFQKIFDSAFKLVWSWEESATDRDTYLVNMFVNSRAQVISIINEGKYSLNTLGSDDSINFNTSIINIVARDQAYNLIWDKSIDNDSKMFASDAEIDSNDNLYIAGSCDNSKETQDNLNESSQSMQNKSYIMKLSDLGDNIWNRSFHGIDCSCENIKISLDNDDNVILSGIYQGELKYDNAVITSTAIGQNNSFIMKIDSDGNFLWAAILEGTGKFSCSSITVALDNTIYCCGNFNGSLASLSNETMTITSGGEDDIFVLSISSSGDILWLNSYGGRLNDQASNITMDNSNIYLTGFFEDSIKST